MPEAKEEAPAFTPEQLATPPSCPPLVGGFGPETPEVKAMREEQGLPEPAPLWTAPEARKAEKPVKAHEAEAPKTPAGEKAEAAKTATRR